MAADAPEPRRRPGLEDFTDDCDNHQDPRQQPRSQACFPTQEGIREEGRREGSKIQRGAASQSQEDGLWVVAETI